MTRSKVNNTATSIRAALMLATSISLVGALVPAAFGQSRQAAPIVFASPGSNHAPVARAPQHVPQTTAKKKKRFSFSRRKKADTTTRAAAPAETERRVEFRYPDQPETFYGAGGARTVADAAPLSFSSSEAAVTREAAAKMTVGTPVAAPVAAAPAPAPVQAVSRDPAITAGGFDARASAKRIEARNQLVSAAGPVDFTPAKVISSPLPAPKPALKAEVPAVPVAVSADAGDVYDKTGTATIFDPVLHGQPTSNGEILDTYSMTAAHPSLPLPSLVQVINLNNGKEVVVRVNDRGPIGGNGLIEVSEKAATVLGFDANGQSNVRVRYLGKAPALSPTEDRSFTPPAAPKTSPAPTLFARSPVVTPQVSPLGQSSGHDQFMVQLASFSDIGNAKRLYERLSGSFQNIGIVQAKVNGVDYFRIVAGPMESRRSAENLRDHLANQGIGKGLVITAP